MTSSTPPIPELIKDFFASNSILSWFFWGVLLIILGIVATLFLTGNVHKLLNFFQQNTFILIRIRLKLMLRISFG